MKNPTLAAILNIIPGLGYLYVGRRKAFGIVILLYVVITIAAQIAYEMYLYANGIEEVGPVPIESGIGNLITLSISMIPVLIGVFMYDAYQDAKRLNNEKTKDHKHGKK